MYLKLAFAFIFLVTNNIFFLLRLLVLLWKIIVQVTDLAYSKIAIDGFIAFISQVSGSKCQFSVAGIENLVKEVKKETKTSYIL